MNLVYKNNFSFDNQKQLDLYGWNKTSFRKYEDYGMSLKLKNIVSENDYIKNVIRYHRDPNDDYFPEGPNTSIADGSFFCYRRAFRFFGLMVMGI